ncbi:MAG: hypothetical protein IJX80_01245 [Clostridia bacterium]|nr:hypothetical protein [Clostridia bacterium]
MIENFGGYFSGANFRIVKNRINMRATAKQSLFIFNNGDCRFQKKEAFGNGFISAPKMQKGNRRVGKTDGSTG